MENHESKLGFDAQQAINELNKLSRGLEKMSKQMNASASATEGLNTEQAQADAVLKKMATGAELAAGALKSLSGAQKAAARTARELNAEQAKGIAAAKAAGKARAQALIGAAAGRSLTGQIGSGLRDKATLPEVVAFDRSLENFQKIAGATDLSVDRVRSILRNLGDSYTGEARRIRDAAAQVVRANADLGRANVRASARILKDVLPGRTSGPTKDDAFGKTLQQANAQKVAEQIRATESALRGAVRGSKELGTVLPTALNKSHQEATKVELGLRSIMKIAATQVALSGLFRLIDLFKQGGIAAKDFEIQLAQIQTISGTFAQQGLGLVGDAVAGISEQFGLSLEDVASGLYETLSNQVGTAAESTRFLGDAAIFSRASVTTLSDSVDLLSAVMNSYGLSAESAGDISGKLFRTIDLGRVRGDELANTIGRVLPLAAELGVSFDEVAASIAHLTIQGVKANEAYTLTSNVMLKLIRPTVALQKELDRLGIASVEAGIQAFGFQGLLEKVTAAAGNSASEVGELFNQIRGTRGVLGIAGKSAEGYAKTLEKIKEATAETAEAAAALVLSTPAAELNRQLAQARSFLVNDFGRGAVSAVSNLIKIIGGAKNAVIALGVALAGLAAAGIAFALASIGANIISIGVALKGSAAAATLLSTTLAALPFVAVVAGGAAIAFALTRISDNASAATAKLADLKNQLDQQAKIEAIGQKKIIKEREAAINQGVRAAERSLFALQQAYNKDKDAAIQAQDAISDNLKGQLSKRTSMLNSFIGSLQGIQSRASNNIKSLTQNSLDLKFDSGQRDFERGLKGGDPAAQAEALVKRTGQILFAAREAAAKGNNEFAQTLFGSAAELANRAADLDITKQNSVNIVLRERLMFNEKLIAQEKAQADEAAKLEEHNKGIATEIEKRIARLSDIKLLDKDEDASAASINERLRERRQLTGEIDQLLGKVSAGGLGDVIDTVALKTQVRELAQGFTDPTSGVTSNLTAAFDSQAHSVLNTLQQTVKNTPLDFIISLKTATGIDFDPIEGPKKMQAALARVADQLKLDNQNSINTGNLRNDFKKAQAEISLAQAGLKQGVQDKGVRNAIAGGFLNGISQEVDQAAAEVTRINALVRDAKIAVNTGDANALSKILAQINQAIEIEKQAAGFVTTSGQLAKQQVVFLEQLANGITSAAEAAPKLQQALATEGAFTDVLGTLGTLETTAISAVAGAQSAFDEFTADNLAKEIARAKQELQSFINQPRISDPSFRPQLSPVNRIPGLQQNGGGDVTNNVGDVNITITGVDAAKIDGAALGEAVRRELRKNTIKGF